MLLHQDLPVATVVAQLNRKAETELGKLLHVVEADVVHRIIFAVDVRADIREISLNRKRRAVTVFCPRGMVRAWKSALFFSRERRAAESESASGWRFFLRKIQVGV